LRQFGLPSTDLYYEYFLQSSHFGIDGDDVTLAEEKEYSFLFMKIIDTEIYQLGEIAGGGATWASNSIVLKLTMSSGLVCYGEAVPTLRVPPVIQSLRNVARV
jgi:hypothetical protein